MEYSCRTACTVCNQSALEKELIRDRLIWREPFEAIEHLFHASVLDLYRHTISDPEVSDIRKTDFPFFENAGFLLMGSSNWDAHNYLLWTRERVKKPACEADKGFCILVGIVIDYFLQKSNFQSLLDYSDCFAEVQKIVSTADVKEIPDEIFLSDDGLATLPEHWLTTQNRQEQGNWSPDWERIRIYGHGAVAVHRIAILADKEPDHEGIRLLYTDQAKSRWTQRALWQWLRLRFWLERIIPVYRKKEPIDVAYHALRVSFPFDPPEAAILREKIKLAKTKIKENQKKESTAADSEELYKARGELDEALNSAKRESQNSELAEFATAEINRELKPLVCSWKFEKTPLRPDEIASIANTSVGEASVQDRAKTPIADWYLKLWSDFEASKPVPIVERVRRNIIDELRREYGEKNLARGLTRRQMRDILKGKFKVGEEIQPGVYRAEGSETAEEWKQMRVGTSTIFEAIDLKSPVSWEFTEAEMTIMKDQVCKTPEEFAIWQAKIEDSACGLEQLQARVYSETGKDLSVARIWQIASGLQERCKSTKSRR